MATKNNKKRKIQQTSDLIRLQLTERTTDDSAKFSFNMTSLGRTGLVYSPSLNGCFCIYCFLFGSEDLGVLSSKSLYDRLTKYFGKDGKEFPWCNGEYQRFVQYQKRKTQK